MGNLGLALELIASAERLAWGRERAIPNMGMFEKLRVFRTWHTSGTEPARALAARARNHFRGRNPFFYLDAIAATAWVEKRALGHYTRRTEKDLELLNDVPGLKALLIAQGFLT